MVNAEQLEDLSVQKLRELASGLIAKIASKDREIGFCRDKYEWPRKGELLGGDQIARV